MCSLMFRKNDLDLKTLGGESMGSVPKLGKEFFPKYIPEVSISNSQLDGLLTEIICIQNQNFALYLKF